MGMKVIRGEVENIEQRKKKDTPTVAIQTRYTIVPGIRLNTIK